MLGQERMFYSVLQAAACLCSFTFRNLRGSFWLAQLLKEINMAVTDLEKPVEMFFQAPSQVGTQSASQGLTSSFSSLAPALGAIAPLVGIFNSFIGNLRSNAANERQERNAAFNQQQANWAAQDADWKNWESRIVNPYYSDFTNALKKLSGSIPGSGDAIKEALLKGESIDSQSGLPTRLVQAKQLLDSYTSKLQEETERITHGALQPGSTYRDANGNPMTKDQFVQLRTAGIREVIDEQKKILSEFMSKAETASKSFQSNTGNQSLASAPTQTTPTYTHAGADVKLNPNDPSNIGSTVQTSQPAGGQGTQQNFLQRLMQMLGIGGAPGGAGGGAGNAAQGAGQSVGNNNWLSKLFQGAGMGAGNSMDLNPALGGVVGAGLGQIGSAAGNLIGGSFPGQGSQQPGQQQPGYPQQPGGFSNQNFFNGMGINTGDESQNNPLKQLFEMFGIQNPGQAGLGAGILGIGGLLDKDVKLPDFWEDRGVKDLANWGKSASHPMDPNVDVAIQRSMDIQNEQQLRNLRDVYKNARPGGDYLNDSAYQRDLDNLNRKMALNTADAKAGSQLASNQQNIGILSNLAEGSVGQGRIQGLLDTQKQTKKNKLFGDLGSAFIQGSMKPPTTNVQVNR